MYFREDDPSMDSGRLAGVHGRRRYRDVRRRLAVTLLAATTMVGLGATGPSAIVSAADAAATTPLQVTIAPVGATGPKGIAILSATDTGTAVQVLVPGAPASTTAIIHTGSCDAIGNDAVGLLGEINAAGQVEATVPLSLSVLADGNHVIALHPGLDFSHALACGAIPPTTVAPIVPPLIRPVTSPQPGTPPSTACVAVREWITATKARLETLRKLQADANTAALGIDPQAYLTVLAANMGAVGTMVAQLQTQTVPPEATAIQQQFISALQTALESGDLILQGFSSGDLTAYQQGLAKSKEANDAMLKVISAIAALDATCPAPSAPVG